MAGDGPLNSPAFPEETGERMILLLDNYDSFTDCVADLFRQLGVQVDVVRNDKIGIEELGRRNYEALVISPGPGRPEKAGITVPLIRHFAGKLPLLGVCLGHQAIAQAFGCKIVCAVRPMHGKISQIRHEGNGIFRGLPDPFPATRYHSLVAQRESLPKELEITAWTEEGEIMGLRHRELPIEGVQFHPESILTTEGPKLFLNFLRSVEGSTTG